MGKLMRAQDAIRARKSVRAFLDRPVGQDCIVRILDAARWAASGTNTQPWEVVVTRGETRQRVCAAVLDAHQNGVESKMDYRYYPEDWREPYLSRRRSCGLQLYGALEIARDDTTRRREQWVANYRAFDAPLVLFFFLDARMDKGSFLDYGMFIQSVMLAAVDEGLATCPQAALGEYPWIVREMLGVTEDRALLCGMALGYEDTCHPVNQYRTPREPVASFTRFLD
jgi:nitroreductase